ncbi:MAG: hypothetical protein KBS74_03030 [Clostridiales bacterium]|nr:hypothetical protein [Candidatus Cacconaster stercorequi]
MKKRMAIQNNPAMKAHGRRKSRRKVVAVLAAAVMLCTIYALIMPAATVQSKTFCGMDEHPEHTDECYKVEKVLICENADKEHTHMDECYNEERRLVCDRSLHTHSLQCFADPDADVERKSDWEKTIADAQRTGNWAADVVAIAKTQLGYEESSANYRVQSDGVSTKGYTRYGDWYGAPYGDWCAMFCSFCLDYAGVKDFPLDACCEDWINALSKLPNGGRYRPAGEYLPKSGDLIFLDWEATRQVSAKDAAQALEHAMKTVDHVGIVSEVIEGTQNSAAKLRTIEGNNGDLVACHTYDLDSAVILGYGVLPQNPEEVTEKTAQTDDGISVRVSAPNASYPYPADEVMLSAHRVTDAAMKQLLMEKLKEEDIPLNDAILVDVRLTHDGTEIEPIGPVQVAFTTNEELDAVYHVDEEQETITDMQAEINKSGDTVTIETDHFSVFALTTAAGKRVTAEVATTWEQRAGRLTVISITTKCTDQDKMFFCLDKKTEGGDWTPLGNWTTQTKKGKPVTMDAQAYMEADPFSRFRVHGSTATNKDANAGFSKDFCLLDLLDKEKEGFGSWLRNDYVQMFNGEKYPTTTDELYRAFAVYYELPRASLHMKLAMQDSTERVILQVVTDGTIHEAHYAWEYFDADKNAWVVLTPEDSAALDVTNMEILNGGKDVRCVVRTGDRIRAVSDILHVDHQDLSSLLYKDAIDAINRGLHLDSYPVTYGTAAAGTRNVDIRIHGEKYEKYFYWTNLANDKRVPFTDGTTYADYLARTYLRYADPVDGLAAVKKIWDTYLYDMYDPSDDTGHMTNKSTYPAYTYGDAYPDFVKDTNSSSFHGTSILAPKVDALNYNFMEGGVDYSNFITKLEKSAAAVKAGDANTERAYRIDITADAQAKATAPVAMILQIQTAWQLFDLQHANAQKGEGKTEVGSASFNTELANLYDIKQALLRFVDYMEENYPGNNLVLGITETRHDASQTMLLGTDTAGKALYVSNNYDVLRESIRNWDTFGNCEHVHYDSNTLSAAVSNLASNLDGWKDIDGDNINYNDIQKVAVIIGGPTENSNSKNGYACTLPWGTFTSADLNAVYGIRVNEGKPVNGAPVISWIDYAGNNTGAPFGSAATSDGQTAPAKGGGTVNGNFTKKYVATNEDKVFAALVDIAKTEMLKKGVDVKAQDKFVDHVALSDTVREEFVLQQDVPVTATVRNADGSVAYRTVISWETGEVVQYAGGSGIGTTMQGVRTVTDAGGNRVITVAFDETQTFPITVDGSDTTVSYIGPKTLTVTEKPDGTTDVWYDFGRAFNGKRYDLSFGVMAKDDFIGGNNVFPNKGTPELSYEHENMDGTGAPTGESDRYRIRCADTPEVNVPIRFATTDGGMKTILLGTAVDLGRDEELKSHVITEKVEDLVDNYEQINGTLRYTWLLPDGTTQPCGAALVKNGRVQGDFPPLNAEYVKNTAGVDTVTLQVTFTPDAFETDNPNFKQDGVTNVAVNEKTKPGRVWIEGVDESTTLDYTVRKDWNGGVGANTIIFRLSDGAGSYIGEQGADGKWTLVNANRAKTFTIRKEDAWQARITGLPAFKLVDGKVCALAYAPEELNIPAGYTASYGMDMQMDETGEQTPVLVIENTKTVQMIEMVKTDVGGKLRLSGAEFALYGTDESERMLPEPLEGCEKLVSDAGGIFSPEHFALPEGVYLLVETKAPDGYELMTTPLKIRVEMGKVTVFGNEIRSEPVIAEADAATSVCTVCIENSTGYELPESGGIGTVWYVCSGLLLMAAAAVYGYFLWRRQGER